MQPRESMTHFSHSFISDRPEPVASMSTCGHCGKSFLANRDEKFCCSGCEFVHNLLRKEGLDTYYTLRAIDPPACPLPVQSSSETYDYCDDPTFVEKSSPDGRRMEFYLEGMNCTACLWLLEKIPQFCSSAERARVNMANSTIEVRRKEDGSFAEIARTLNRLGYRPHPIHDKTATGQQKKLLQEKENRQDLIRIGVAAFATGNIMILAVSLYGGASGSLGELFKWMTGLLALPVMTYCAWPFYRSAYVALRMKRLNIDVPVVAALLAGIVFSVWGLFSSTETVYFDSLSMLVFLMSSSRFWLKRIQQNHLDVSHLEDFLLLGSVNRVNPLDGQLEKVSSLSLRKDDIVELEPDTVIPVDGWILEGDGFIQTAVLTGEALPSHGRVGDKVEAGARVVSGQFRVQVEKPSSESRLAMILKDAERSTLDKPALVQFADQVSQWFIGVVFIAAFLVFAWFVHSGSPIEGLSRALALIIVSCPCVFGVAIPLSMSLAIRGAARRGIIIKDADVVERLREIKTLFFDKTGTLTKGDLEVLKLDVQPCLDRELAAAVALERNQSHPVARAILRSLKKFSLPHLQAHDVHLRSEGGIEGTVDGVVCSIRPLDETSTPFAQENQIKGHYRFFYGNRPVVDFEIGDQLRPEAGALMQWARQRNLKTSLLSGDRPAVVNTCARQLGLDASSVISAATPERKSQVLKEHGKAALMIGDGANDAAALAAAGVGVAVRGSMDVSLRAADVYLTQSDLTALPALFEIADLTRGAIVRNLIFSASFNLLSGTLAILGWMSPLLAAVLMPISSLIVLASALATGRRFSQEGENK